LYGLRQLRGGLDLALQAAKHLGVAAAGLLREVVKLQPRDQVSPGILQALEKAKDGKGGPPARRPSPGN
jgi:hypothetical protein